MIKIRLFFSLVLLVLFVPFATQAIIEERAPRWDAIHEHFERLVDSYDKNISERQQQVAFWLNDYEITLRQTEKQIAAFSFLLRAFDSNSGFEALMRCRQISDLRTDFEESHTRMRSSLAQLSEAVDLLLKQEEHIRELSATMPSDMRQKFESNLAASARLRIRCQEMLASFRAISKSYEHCDKELNALYDDSETLRERIIHQMFLDPSSVILNRLRSLESPAAIGRELRLIFMSWGVNISGWLQMQFPHKIAYWRNAALLLLLLSVPVLLLGKRKIDPIFRKLGLLQQNNVMRRCFELGIFFGTVTLVCSISQLWANANEDGTIQTLAQSFGAFTMLLFVLAFRMVAANVYKCLQLYLPLLFQHIVGVTLYLTLATGQVLTLLVIAVDIITILWLVHQLRNRNLPWIDLVFGLCGIGSSLTAITLTLLGLPYLGFTILLGTFPVFVRLHLTVIFTRALWRSSSKDKVNLVMRGVTVRHLIIPVIWIWTVWKLFRWGMDTYYLQNLLENWMNTTIHLPQNILNFTPLTVIILILAALLLQFLLLFARELLRLNYAHSPQYGLITSYHTLSTYLAWFLYGLMVLMVMHAQYSSLLVMIGGISMGLGFALKSVLENFISSVTLLAGQMVRAGDYIEVEGVYGRVTKISMRSTTVETNDGAVVTMPNMQLLSTDFRNWTRSNPFRRLQIPIDVDYGSDLPKVIELLRQALHETNGVQQHIPPEILCWSLEESSIRYMVRAWVPEAFRRQVESQYRARVIELFRANGVSIPFPQLDVHMPEAAPAT